MKKAFNFAFMQELFLAFVHYAGALALTVFECVFFVNNSPDGWLKSVFFLMAVVFSLGSVALWDSWCYNKKRVWALFLAIIACLFIVVPVANISISGLSSYSVAQDNKSDADKLVELSSKQAEAISSSLKNNTLSQSSVKGWAASELAANSAKQTELSQKAFADTYAKTEQAIKLKQQVVGVQQDKARDFSGFESIANALKHPEWTLIFLFIFYLGRAAVFQVIVFATTPKKELLYEIKDTVSEEPPMEGKNPTEEAARGEETTMDNAPMVQEVQEEPSEVQLQEEPVQIQEVAEKVRQRKMKERDERALQLFIAQSWEYAKIHGKIPNAEEFMQLVVGRNLTDSFYKRWYPECLRRAVALHLVDAQGNLLVQDSTEASEIIIGRKLPRS